MTRTKSIYLALLAVLLSPMAANADTIRVSQESSVGAGDFDSNVLGFIDSFDSLLSASDYYAYNTAFAASFNDGAQDVTLTSNISHFFFVSGSDGLSAFIVHDKPSDGAGGQAGMTFDLAGDTASILVRDDNEGGYTDTGTQFTTSHNWIACCTDGLVIGTLDGNWSLFAEFDSRSWSDFAGWMALDGDTTIGLTSDLDRRVRFDVVSVPEPTTLALLGIGLFGMGLSRRKKA